jgi:hypothetical protein
VSVDEQDPEGEAPDDERVAEGEVPGSIDAQPEDPDYPGRESPEPID